MHGSVSYDVSYDDLRAAHRVLKPTSFFVLVILAHISTALNIKLYSSKTHRVQSKTAQTRAYESAFLFGCALRTCEKLC